MTERLKNLICIIMVIAMPLSGYGMVLCSQEEKVTVSTIFHDHCDHNGQHEHSREQATPVASPTALDKCNNCSDSLIVHELIKPTEIDKVIFRADVLSLWDNSIATEKTFLAVPNYGPIPSFFHPLSSIVILS